MSIYILVGLVDYEPSNNLDVFLELEDARESLAEWEKKLYPYDRFELQEWRQGADGKFEEFGT